MFRKPKNPAKKAAMNRRKTAKEDDDDNDKYSEKEGLTINRLNNENSDDSDENNVSQELAQARKRAKTNHKSNTTIKATPSASNDSTIMHQFEVTTATISQKDLVTSTNQNHPIKAIDRGNKLLAGPIRAPTNIRTTCRFDYQPDICKDYKDTGFCGFGDTCIYLHDRGDTLSGWQLEEKWQQEQDLKKKKQQEEMDKFMNAGKIMEGGINSTTDANSNTVADDGLPFACHICREAFKNPVVTSCQHYFCEPCIMQHVKEFSTLCPICNKETHGVFNQPTKLMNKKRKVCGRDSSWEDFLEACKKNSQTVNVNGDQF